MPDVPRYAIYYTPGPDHPLTRAAVAWLGRDAFPGGNPAPLGEAAASMTSEPRRYGFHATLKAPFRLAEGCTVEQLEQAMADFAAASRPCPIGGLQVASLHGFIALRPVAQSAELAHFVGAIVRAFDAFRAPLNAAELERRLRTGLGQTEQDYLRLWGYPYVFERFRFHMTLTNALRPDLQASIADELAQRLRPCLAETYALDALTLFEQEAPGADFTVRSRFALGEMA